MDIVRERGENVMKLSKKINLNPIYTILIIIAIFLIVLYYIFISNTHTIEFALQSSSIIISLASFNISFITFTSIHSINQATSMNGNVLENDSYSVSYCNLLRNFDECTTEEEFSNKLIQTICNDLNKNKYTCMQFSDSIQKIIDHIILFPYINDSNKTKGFYKKIIKEIDSRYDIYDSLSNGTQYTIRENIKLIKCVLQYQNNDLAINDILDLQDISSGLIKNPISKIIYFNYLGLYFLKKTDNFIKGKTNNSYIYNQCDDYWEAIKEVTFTAEDKDYISMLLSCASQALKKAEESAKKDVLWQGYIKYNIVRVYLLEFLIDSGKDSGELSTYINEVIHQRKNVYRFFALKESSYLNSKLKYELQLSLKLSSDFNKIIAQIYGG